MRTRRSVYLAYLHTLSFALLIIGSILLLSRPQYAGHAVEAAASASAVAAAALLLGGTLLGAAYRKRRVAGPLGLSLGFIAVLAIFSQFPPGQALADLLGFGSLHHLPPALAVVLLILVLSMVLQSRSSGKTTAARGLAWVATVMGVLSLMSTFPEPDFIRPLPGWDQFLYRMRFAHEVEATFNTSILTILLGVGCLLLGSKALAEPAQLDRRTLLLGLLGTAMTCFSWHLMHIQNLETVQARSDILLTNTHLAIQQQRLAHIALVNRIAERWQTLERVPSGPLWEQESAGYLRDFPNIELFGVLDQTLRPVRVIVRKPTDQLGLQPFLTDNKSRDWLQHALLSGEAHLSGILSEERPTALLATPLRLSNQGSWLVVATLDVEQMVKQHVNPSPSDFIVRVEEQNRLLYASSPLPPESLIYMGDAESAYHHDSTWRITVYMNRRGTLLRSAFLPPLLLFFGLGLTLLLMISQRLAWESNKRNKELDDANLELSASLAEQSRLRDANQRIMEYSRDLLCAFDAHGNWTQVNPACRDMLGYEASELIGAPFETNLLAEDVASTVAAALSARHGDGVPVDFRNRYRRRDGTIAHLMWSAAWSEVESELFCVARDVTDLVAAEKREHDRKHILGMISTDQPLPGILKAICLLAESQQDGTKCSLRLLDHECRYLLGGAAPHLPKSYTAALDGLEIKTQSALIQFITTEQQVLVSDDIATDPVWDVPVPAGFASATYAELAAAHGLRAFWGLPIISPAGQTLGSLGIYRDQVGPPTEAQIEFARTCSQLAAIALDRHHDRLQLSENEQRYRSLFTYNPDPVYSTDLEGTFQSFNQAAAGLLGCWAIPQLT